MGACCHKDDADDELAPLIQNATNPQKILESLINKPKNKRNIESYHDTNLHSIVDNLSEHVIIMKQIKDLISKYCKLYCNIDIFAFMIRYRDSTATNLSSNKRYEMDTFGEDDVSKGKLFQGCFIINNMRLPQVIIDKNKSNKSLSTKQLYSNQWSVNLSMDISQATMAFHREKFKYQCYSFTFKLPALPIKWKNESEVQSLFGPVCPIAYNHTKNILYSSNIDPNTGRMDKSGKTIYSLDFNTANQWKWKWKTLASNLSYSRYNTINCMVDNDRFISILGGLDEQGAGQKHAELYSLEYNQSITLKDMNKYRKCDWGALSGCSLYHEYYNKIIVGTSRQQFEWYDVNKDKWIVFEKPSEPVMQQMFISKINPNILMYLEKTWPKQQGTGNKQVAFMLYQLDLRATNEKPVPLTELDWSEGSKIIHC